MNHLNVEENCCDVFHTLTLGFFKATPKRDTKSSRMVSMKEKYQAIMDVIEHQDQDLALIKDVLKQASQDSKASQLSKCLIKSELSKRNVDPLVLLQHEITRCSVYERHTDLLSHLTELLNQYPNGEKLYCSNPDELDEYLQERETHHAKVLVTVETYLPEVYQHIRETHLNHLHSSNLG